MVVLNRAVIRDPRWILDEVRRFSVEVETGHDEASQFALDQHADNVYSGNLSGAVCRFAGPGSWVGALCSRLWTNISRKVWKDRVLQSFRYEAQSLGCQFLLIEGVL